MISEIKIYETKEELYKGAAELIAGLISSYIRLHFKCTIALSGGTTPGNLYNILAKRYKQEIDWNNVFLFWGDERFVPAEHPDSNYKLASENLISKVSMHKENIFKINTDVLPDDAAGKYEGILKKFFGDNELPVFDIILLGLGKDGHTASIFPGTPAEYETNKWVMGYHVDSIDSNRITFTLPVINNAKNVIFLIAGEDKREIVEKIFIKQEENRFPALKVKPQNGTLFYLMDRAAAGELKEQINQK
jgi:6-phosphogluconolactonase